jgi:hypothetical protein
MSSGGRASVRAYVRWLGWVGSGCAAYNGADGGAVPSLFRGGHGLSTFNAASAPKGTSCPGPPYRREIGKSATGWEW